MGLRRHLRKVGLLKTRKSPDVLSGTGNVTRGSSGRQVNDSPLFHFYCEFPAIELIDEFTVQDVSPTRDLATNFLGVKMPARVMPSILGSKLGTVESPPIPGNWHADIAEWASALLSVREARDTYRIVEVGCAWGCWLNNMGVVAKRNGLKIDLIGIEGDVGHLKNAESTLKINGIAEHEFQLFNGVAAPKKGLALFPKIETSGENWGTEAIFYPDDEALSSLRKAKTHVELDCYTLADLSNGKPIDLLHIDIQGAELDFVIASFEQISSFVKRVLIGTHSRYLEGCLMKHFLDHGWRLEMERPQISEVVNGSPENRIDGVLLFKNPSTLAEKP